MSALESALLGMVVFLVLFVWCQSIRMDSLERRIDKTITRVSEVEGDVILTRFKIRHWEADAGGFVRLSRAAQQEMDKAAHTRQQDMDPWWKDPRNFEQGEGQ